MFFQIVSKILWFVCGLSGCFAFLNSALSNPTSAPQQAAVAAQACATAIIPYILARAWDNLFLEQMEAARAEQRIPKAKWEPETPRKAAPGATMAPARTVATDIVLDEDFDTTKKPR
jgi:hypothetical protein